MLIIQQVEQHKTKKQRFWGSFHVSFFSLAGPEGEKLNSWLMKNQVKACFASHTRWVEPVSLDVSGVTQTFPASNNTLFMFYLSEQTMATLAPHRLCGIIRPLKRWEWPCFEMESNSGKVPRVEWKQLWSCRVYFPRVYYWWSSHRNIKPWSRISIMWSITVFFFFFFFFLIILARATVYEI